MRIPRVSLEYVLGVSWPPRISRGLAMAEFSVKIALCGAGCLKLAHRSVIEQAYQTAGRFSG